MVKGENISVQKHGRVGQPNAVSSHKLTPFLEILPRFRKVKGELEPYAMTINRIIVILIEEFLIIITIKQP